MATLHLLGTSSGLINPNRNPSAYLIEGDTTDLLMDCGGGLSRRLAQRTYDWSRLSTIVITHTHADHAGGLPMLIQQLYLSKRTTPLAICAPAEYAERLLELLQLHYMFPEVFSFEVSIEALTAGEAFTSDGLTITPYPTQHFERARAHIAEHGYPNRCEAFALRVETGASTFLYSGDLGAFADIRDLLPGCALAVLDSTHIDVAEVLNWAKENSGTQLYLSHVSPEFDEPALLADVRSRRLLNVHVAADEMALPL